MNTLNSTLHARQLVEMSIPKICEDGPLFPLAWHARIFALIVAMVENGHIDWKAFQSHLVAHLKEHEDEQRGADEINTNYFEQWLEAAEDTLVSLGLMAAAEVPEQIARIEASVAALRHAQSALGHPLKIDQISREV